MTPSSAHSYGEAAYWDARYAKEGAAATFDWYQRYEALAPLFELYLKKSDKILMVGCGNAVLSETMADDGYQEVWNIDISSVAINAMKAKNVGSERLKYGVMDVRKLDFGDQEFDAVVDKGTLDSIMCGESSTENAHAMLSQISRVLKPGGIYFLVTYGDPRTRMPHLCRSEFVWSVRLHVLPRPGANVSLGGGGGSSRDRVLEPVGIGADNRLTPSGIHFDDASLHYVYICQKADKDDPDSVLKHPHALTWPVQPPTEDSC